MNVEHDENLFERLHAELYRLAQVAMAGQDGRHTLQATALIGEAYLRLGKDRAQGFKDQEHFLNTAARAMRHVLVDHARRKSAAKRSGKVVAHALDDIAATFESGDTDLEALHTALEELEKVDPPMASAVDLHYFGQVGVPETARLIGMNERTFRRKWTLTRAWLRERMTR